MLEYEKEGEEDGIGNNWQKFSGSFKGLSSNLILPKSKIRRIE